MERPILTSSLGLCHEIPSPCCSAVASLSEPKQPSLRVWDSAFRSWFTGQFLRPLQLWYKVSHDYFTCCSWWVLHEFSSCFLWRQAKSIYNCCSNISHFRFLTSQWTLSFHDFPKGNNTIRPSVQWGSNHALVFTKFPFFPFPQQDVSVLAFCSPLMWNSSDQ